MTSTASPSVHLSGRPLDQHRHICGFFNSKQEERRTLLGFIKEGFEQGDKAVHVVASDAVTEHRTWLSENGVDVAEAEQRRQLEISTWEDTYLADGCFDQYRQLKRLEDVLVTAHDEGFRQTRIIANMEWALENVAGVDDVVEFESRLNDVLPHYPDVVICTYDLSRFNAGVAIDVLRTHRAVIVGGVLQENPLFLPPEEFLAELRARRIEIASP
jgi:hypothetical protein